MVDANVSRQSSLEEINDDKSLIRMQSKEIAPKSLNSRGPNSLLLSKVSNKASLDQLDDEEYLSPQASRIIPEVIDQKASELDKSNINNSKSDIYQESIILGSTLHLNETKVVSPDFQGVSTMTDEKKPYQ